MNSSADGPTPRDALTHWFSADPGAAMLRAGAQKLRQILPNLFGYHILQLGRYGNEDLLTVSRISHRACLHIDPDSPAAVGEVAVCRAAAMPFAADSVDVLVLPHVLEFEGDPHQVLREVERVLIGEGHVVIIAFNPWSLCGLLKIFLAWRDQAPWSGRFLGMSRLREWLQLLGFEMVSCQHFFYRPPIRSSRLLARLAFLEKLGAYLLNRFGGAYVMVAKKRLLTLIPIRPQWNLSRRHVAAGLVEPSARSSVLHD
jgi:SAM-dependent methyltransferase